MTSTRYIYTLLFVCITFLPTLKTHADTSLHSSLFSTSSNHYGPIERDCHHPRIACIEGSNTLFAVKGPLTKNQANQLCPSTPRQTAFKRNRLPSHMQHPMIIVNVGSDIIEYSQRQNSIQKTSLDTLPIFSYVLCGTTAHKPNSGLHINADKPIKFDTFLENSFAADQIINPPTNKIFKADNRKFEFGEVALGDGLAYVVSLFPSAEVNYDMAGNHITGYTFSADLHKTAGRFDKEERLYEFTTSIPEHDSSFSETLNSLVEQYGKPMVKGSSSLDHDLDPLNDVKSGTYIWKIAGGGYLTISIKTTLHTQMSVKMIDINQAEKALDYVTNTKKQL